MDSSGPTSKEREKGKRKMGEDKITTDFRSSWRAHGLF